MQPNERDLAVADAIDRGFRGGVWTPELQTDAEKRKSWYALFLTTLTATAARGEIIWAQMQPRKEENEAFFTVVTTDVVISAHVSAIHLKEPLVEVRAFGRKALTTIDVYTGAAIDDASSAAHAWPGEVKIAATYRTPDKELVVFVAPSKQSDGSKDAPVLRLLAELTKDLNS